MNSIAYLRSISTTLVLSLIALHGCTPSDQFATVSVEGTVTLNGKPLSDAHVWLLPKASLHQQASLIVRPQGRTDIDGKFVLTTYYQGDGAPEGDYDAIVLHGDNDPDASSEESKSQGGRIVVPMKYKDVKTSGLAVTIKKGGQSNVLTFELKSR